MALYRTDRKLNWNHALQIGHWYAPWSSAATDTGSDYFSRTLRWLRQQYPKANIRSASHPLPVNGEDWPQQRFGLPEDGSPAAPSDAHSDSGSHTGGRADDSPNGAGTPNGTGTHLAAQDEPPHAGDLLIIEWPQGTATSPSPQAQTEREADAATPPSTVWINGLERALRRHWQDNPEAEVIFVGGTDGLPPSGLALAAHYGIHVLDPVPLLRPQSPDAPDPLQALIHNSEGAANLSPQGQEIWAGMLISLLRAQVRYGPTPEPVNLPDGLWCR